MRSRNPGRWVNNRIRNAWGRGGVAAAAVALVGVSAAFAAGTPGMLDATFDGGDGIVTTAGMWSVLDVAVQPVADSERYLVVGQAASSKPTGVNGDWMVLAYTRTGSLDAAFGAAGNGTVRLFPTDPNATFANDVSLDDQNRIVVGGTSTVRTVTTYDNRGRPTGTQSYRGLTVVRLTSDGHLDSSFGGTGIVTVWAGSPNGYNEVGVSVVAVPASLGGGIVAAGTSFYVQSPATKKVAAVINRRLFLAKFRDDGTLDPAFGAGGIAYDLRSSEPRLAALALQSDGRVIVGEHLDITAGTNTAAYNWVVSRFTSAGALDTAFGASGRVIGSTYLLHLAVGDDDSIVAVGGIAPSDGRAARYLANGALDSTFDGDGLAGFIGSSSNVALQADTRVVFCGQAYVGSTAYGRVGRLAGDGSLDGSFGAGGYAALLPAGWWAQAAAEAADGIVVAGSAGSGSNQIFVARYGK